MNFLVIIAVFLLGISIGSFLNVLICRLPKTETIRGRSYCPKCGHKLAWHDLIPLLSFVLLRRRCRYCKQKISWQYPLVELSAGLLFVFLLMNFWNFEIGHWDLSGIWDLGFGIFITSCLIVIFVSDLKYFIIPDEIILAGIIGFFIFKLFGILNLEFVSDFGHAPLDSLVSNGVKISDFKILLNPLLSAIAASAFFLAIALVTRGKGMGLGDVKLAFLMGFLLGWPKILLALLLAFVSGALIGIILILAGKAKMKSEIPFGAFLAASLFFVMILGEGILNAYLRLFV